jgi:hypothetical protein
MGRAHPLKRVRNRRLDISKEPAKVVRGKRRPGHANSYHPAGVMPADAPSGESGKHGGDAEGGAMTEQGEPTQGLALNTGPLLAGAVLIGIGSLLGLAGLAIAGAALGAAARRYVNQMEVPPSELAKQNLAKARAAASAGASAWRNGAAQPVISDQ